ncbi:MAG: polysaccharide biosynthesis protein [Lachnospiraceae bacterium]|nr:polysaccharide biosynthesis protein [Lachnospiraceae bacterium]
MSKTKKSESNFLVQGSILAIASIISRVIGLLYRIPLKSIIGDIGNDYYGTAMEIYSILLLISSYSLPVSVSKLVSTRMAKGQRKNAYRIFKGALLFALVSGSIASLLVYFGADFITTYVVNTPLSIFALQTMAPTLLIVAVLGVIRGFYQGMGTMMPSALSQLLEQIANAIASVTFAYMLYQYGIKIGAVLGNPSTYAEAYGASGGTIGTGVGALVALVTVLIIFLLYRSKLSRMLEKDKGKHLESYGRIFSILVLTILPVLLSTTIYNITSFLDTSVFKQIAASQGYKATDYSTMWGIYVGEYKVMVNVPIAIASSVATSSVPSLSTAFAAKDIPQVKRKVAYSIRFIMIIAIPCAVGMGVLASPILQLLFQDSRKMPELMMQIGAVSIIFYSLSTLSNGILQGINRMNIPVKNALITLILHMGVLVVLMYGLDLNIYAVVWANTFFSFFMCVLNGMAIRKYLRYKQEILRTFVIPSICAAVMGAAVYGMYQLLMGTINSNVMATTASIIIGVIVYGVLMLLLRGLREKELLSFPMGHLIIRVAKKLHLMR